MKECFQYCDAVTVSEENKYAYVTRKRDVQMSIRHIQNGWICPWSKETEDYQGEVLLEDGSIITDVCSGNIYPKKRQIPPSHYDVKDSAIYLGSINICWGHYITDGISKLWSLQADEIKNLIAQGTPVIFVAEWMTLTKIPLAWQKIIDLLGGTDIEIIPLQTNTKFKHIYIPTNSIQNTCNGRIFTKEFVNIRTSLLEAALKEHKKWPIYEKIYLSRTKLVHDHAEFGEQSIERIFRKVGFKIIYPERLPFEEQIWYLNNSKVVAGTMGSISHNFMFCKEKTKAIILRKAWYTNDFQYVVNQVADIEATYIDCHLSVFVNEDTNDGPFFLYINENFMRFINEWYGMKIQSNFNIHLFTQYALNCMKRPNFDKRTVSPHFYYEQMQTMIATNPGFFKRIYHKVIEHIGPNIKSRIKSITKKYTR